MNDKPWLAHYDKGVPHTIEYSKCAVVSFFGRVGAQISRPRLHDLQRRGHYVQGDERAH